MMLNVVKTLLPGIISFALGIGFAPVLTNFLYKHKMWKKRAGKRALDGGETPIFNKLHETREVGVPKMGGAVVVFAASATAVLLWLLPSFVSSELFEKLDFVSRGQTWLPFAALLLGALVGLADDFLEVRGTGSHIAGGLSLRKRLIAVAIISLFAAAWFFVKLDVNTVSLPFLGEINLGIFFIPLFAIIALAVYSGGVIDGIDGLAGGVFAIMFGAYSLIAFFQDQFNLAAFCAAIVGGILAFLWFNIPPARFYLSETGTMALTLTLTIVAFMTDALGEGKGIAVLPIIAAPLLITTLSNIAQVASKKFRGKKIFLVAPLHHHFEALGWPPYKVTMRYWVLSVLFAMVGTIVALIG
ncbi:MAG: hypothetical protein A3C08_02810 [Candidatus Taylorbacteria bacterium RIFCSPHIGHO2_02_FULL_47_18]|uniref:Phospho-N-acetylmuramoyl-pentapeptide-transferase n=1 Tax=Candidatus Taylorbacteria bacterium RIFCSPLOWO2_01_FULL_48_100 TaxID=1802322 RepID=A0A1G2NCM9_9BACT|nr:MAG: hypothetical protein A2670_01190 [Candidatus Taylorbacteria bacterium RIFCSPHIGHO2_01_FULL_48_38]OHA27630.1 MAG: hypothetical protein A3C08_02810 [Candidatus Taylorbacteria bacterium RIFCSPHIGHO2_02_FULL_47_18]OHA33813.1 MAG: hypothetical protein A2938_01630 [Candidatus Taylorbacteria bacterium RIFCSPLOWO2_01_FULL_48_100]